MQYNRVQGASVESCALVAPNFSDGHHKLRVGWNTNGREKEINGVVHGGSEQIDLE